MFVSVCECLSDFLFYRYFRLSLEREGLSFSFSIFEGLPDEIEGQNPPPSPSYPLTPLSYSNLLLALFQMPHALATRCEKEKS